MFDDFGSGCTGNVCILGVGGLLIFAFATLAGGCAFIAIVPVALDVAFDVP